MSTRHDPKVQSRGGQGRYAAVEALSEWGVRCSLVKIVEREDGERKAGVKVGMGALEVQIAVRFFDDVPAKVGVIFRSCSCERFLLPRT